MKYIIYGDNGNLNLLQPGSTIIIASEAQIPFDANHYQIIYNTYFDISNISISPRLHQYQTYEFCFTYGSTTQEIVNFTDNPTGPSTGTSSLYVIIGNQKSFIGSISENN